MIGDALLSLFRGAAETVDLGNPRDPAIAKMFGMGSATTAGWNVTEEKSLGLPTFWRGTNIIANGIKKLPMSVMRYTDQEKQTKEFDREHPAWKLVTRKVNSNLGARSFRQTLTGHAIAWGNGTAWINRNAAGDAFELIPFLPDRTRLVRFRGGAAETNLEGEGDLVYVSRIGNEWRRFLPENVFHIKGLSFTGLWGYSVVELLKECIAHVAATDEFGAGFFGRSAVPSGIVTMQNSFDDEEAEERFLDSLKKAHAGLGKSHRLMLLEEGMTWNAMTIEPEHAQFLQSREFNTKVIANVIGVQSHKLGDSSRKSYNSLEQSNQEHKEDDLGPWICSWEEESEDKLLRESEKDEGTHKIGFDEDAMEFVPFRDLVDGTSKAYGAGLIDRDEGRNKLRYGPSKGDNGEKYLVPKNMRFEDEPDTSGGVQRQAPQEPEQPDNSDAMDAARAVLLDACGRVVRRITNQARAKAKAGGKKFVEWLDGLPANLRPITDELAPAARNWTAAGGSYHVAGAGRWLEQMQAGFDTRTRHPYTAEQLESEVNSLADTYDDTAPPSLVAAITGGQK